MEIDRVPISQLPSRYGIARSALYTRLKDLKIEPEKQGKKAFVNAFQLQQLDALHEHIQKGGTTGEFLKQHSCPGQLSTEDSPGQSRTSFRTVLDIFFIFLTIAKQTSLAFAENGGYIKIVVRQSYICRRLNSG
jgi:hypothetical protein